MKINKSLNHSVATGDAVSSAASIASRLFDGDHAQADLEHQLLTAGVRVERIGWDYYDCSLELHGVADDYRLSPDVQLIIHTAGFAKVYVNHQNKWETHYTFAQGEFVARDGWRVSYPHKREKDGRGILLEKSVTTWPQEWLESGYASIVKQDSAALSDQHLQKAAGRTKPKGKGTR